MIAALRCVHTGSTAVVCRPDSGHCRRACDRGRSSWPGIPITTRARSSFSYLGDIWIANEDGSGVASRHRSTPRATSIRASRRTGSGSRSRRIATATTTCSWCRPRAAPRSSSRSTAATTKWSAGRATASSVLFRAARGVGAFPNVATLHEIAIDGGQEQPLPTDWGCSGSFSPDGRSLVFNRHPSTWSRRHYRGSYRRRSLGREHWRQDLHAAARRRALQPLLADVGRRRCDLLRGRSAAEREERQARQPRGPHERQQHLQDSREGRASRCR